jgi:hypothetical protein
MRGKRHWGHNKPSFVWATVASDATMEGDCGLRERVMGFEPTTFCLGSRHSAN